MFESDAGGEFENVLKEFEREDFAEGSKGISQFESEESIAVLVDLLELAKELTISGVAEAVGGKEDRKSS